MSGLYGTTQGSSRVLTPPPPRRSFYLISCPPLTPSFRPSSSPPPPVRDSCTHHITSARPPPSFGGSAPGGLEEGEGLELMVEVPGAVGKRRAIKVEGRTTPTTSSGKPRRTPTAVDQVIRVGLGLVPGLGSGLGVPRQRWTRGSALALSLTSTQV